MTSTVLTNHRIAGNGGTAPHPMNRTDLRLVGGSGNALVELALSPSVGGQTSRLEANEAALDPQDAAGKVVFVREGLLRVYHSLGEGKRRLVGLVSAGHFAGLEALAGAEESSTTMIAAEPSTVVIVDAAKLLQLALTDPAAGRELTQELARRATQVEAQLTEATLLDCETQLLHVLVRLGRAAGQDGNGWVTLRLTQQDLADALGIARETVNGMLQRLGSQQLIAKGRGRINFDVTQLAQWASHAKN